MYDKAPRVSTDYDRISSLASKLSSRVLRELLTELSGKEVTEENSRSIDRIEYELELRRGQGE